jgi:hypothetical protein
MNKQFVPGADRHIDRDAGGAYNIVLALPSLLGLPGAGLVERKF